MGFESSAGSVAVKTTSWIVLPTLWISLFFLVCMIGFYGIQSIQSSSIEPLLNGVLFNVVGADHKISYLMDSYIFEYQYFWVTDSFKGFFNWLWERLVFWFQIVQSLWFIYVFCVLIYFLVNFMGGDMMPMFNKILFVILVFAILQYAIGSLMYDFYSADKVCTGSKTDCMMLKFSHSIPFEGTFKLFKHTIFNKDFFNNVYQLNSNKYVQTISSIPNNSTGV